jgi:Sap, sulfolipid-1-addressing protein
VWSSVLGAAFLLALNPVRLAIVLLLMSRPRPVQNLLAYWVGNLMVSIPFLLVPLMVLHATPTFTSLARDSDTSSTVRHIKLGMGVLTLAIAALMAVRSRTRERAQLPTPGGNASTLVSDSNKPTAISRLLGRARDVSTEDGSAIWRLLGRAHNAWENGSLWVALVFGIICVPPPEMVLFVLAVIVTSGAASGVQVSAAIAFVFALHTILEITLVSYLAAPAKTEAVLRVLHDWASAHRRQILIAMFAVIGVALVTNNIGSV